MNPEDFPIATIKPDERGRFNLKKYTTGEAVTEWRLYRSKDGRHIHLEAVLS